MQQAGPRTSTKRSWAWTDSTEHKAPDDEVTKKSQRDADNDFAVGGMRNPWAAVKRIGLRQALEEIREGVPGSTGGCQGIWRRRLQVGAAPGRGLEGRAQGPLARASGAGRPQGEDRVQKST